MKIILLGAPGAGKGTQAVVISEKVGVPAISTGNIIRAAIKTGTKTGLVAKEYVDAGKLVPDEVVIGIIKERLQEDDCKGGYILDGFPRNIGQTEALEKMGIEIDLAINIEVPDEVVEERLGGRKMCEKCNAGYHTVSKPSLKGDACELCGGQLIVRNDDKPEVIRARLQTYHAETAPLMRYYQEKGKLREVIGSEGIEETTASVMAVLGAVS